MDACRASIKPEGKAEMRVIDIAKVRERYPHPCRIIDAVSPDNPPIEYCVGGALCQFFRPFYTGITRDHFPSVDDLADLLSCLNATLSSVAAQRYAFGILLCNEECFFEQAWAIAAKAVNDVFGDAEWILERKSTDVLP